MPWPTPMHMVTIARRAPVVSRAFDGGHGEAGAGCAEGVAEGDGAAVGVHAGVVFLQAELAQDGDALRGRRPRSAR